MIRSAPEMILLELVMFVQKAMFPIPQLTALAIILCVVMMNLI